MSHVVEFRYWVPQCPSEQLVDVAIGPCTVLASINKHLEADVIAVSFELCAAHRLNSHNAILHHGNSSGAPDVCIKQDLSGYIYFYLV